ncbi:MAG: FAD-dependent oxidoreductase [Opitutaceae bacterium]
MPDADTLEFDIVVLGGGFAGVYCAQAIERALPKSDPTRVALISEENYMVFQPMLAEVAGGAISPRHVVNPLRLLCERADILKGVVESIDWPGRKLILLAGPLVGRTTVKFKHLVVSLGAIIDLRRIPGMPEHAFLMQNVGDAMLLRATLISRLEEANIEREPALRKRLLTFVVVGGGYSGVETAGQMIDLFRDINRYYANVSFDDIEVILVHSREHVLPTLDPKLGDYCANVMRSRGLKLRLSARVQAVTATQVKLSDGESITAATVISTVGNAPHPLILDLIAKNKLQTDHGRIVTDELMRVPGKEGLWSAGDCAAVPFVTGGWCPQTAQFAYRQGRALGRNLAASARGKPLAPFRFKGLGELASIGHRTAVAHIFGFNFYGFIAWWMWRTIYLMKLPRIDRKLRVMMEWSLDLFFPRDINMLSPRYSTQLKEIHLEPGDAVFEAGEPAFSLYVVAGGKIELLDGKEVVSSLHQGDYFGERALLSDEKYMFSGRAAEPSTLVSIPAGVFKQIVGAGGSLGRLFKKSATRYQSREVIDSLANRLPPDVLDAPVSSIMQSDLVGFSPGQTIAEVLPTLREQPHGSYPVVDDNRKFIGLIRRDDFHDFLKRAGTTGASTLAEIDCVKVPSVRADLPVRKVVEHLVRSGVNKLVVTDSEDRLQGIVTVMDLAAAAARSGAIPVA